MPDNNNGKALIHASAEVSVDPNNTTAFMTILPPKNGGLDITFERAMAAVTAKNISYGILEDSIKDAVDNRRYDENICVARWTAPIDGDNGKVTYNFSIDNTIRPVEDEKGIVDFKNLGLVKNITAGTVIATITLPTQGEPGRDITGRTVPQIKGAPAVIRPGKGTELIKDGTELIASVDGNLRYAQGSFSVDEQLVIRGDVDTASGNIDFIGSVQILGSVFEGFKVKSRKSISVNGSVTGAELEAEGDISVRIGAINSKITCGGNLHLGFCENTRAHCEGSVDSASFVGGEVFAGKEIKATGKGTMIGGKYTALENIEASVIGSESYTKTMITLGNNAVLSEERDQLGKSLAEMEDKCDQLEKILVTLGELAKAKKLTPEHEQIKTEALRNRLKMQQEIKKTKKRVSEIDASLELCQKLSVSIRKSVYPGVTLRINACVLAVNAVNSHCRATISNEGEIVFMPL